MGFFKEGIFFYRGNYALTIEVNGFVLILTNVGLAEYLLIWVWTKRGIIISSHMDGLQTALI